MLALVRAIGRVGDANASGPAAAAADGGHSSTAGSRQWSRAERASTGLVVLVWLRVTDRLLVDNF